MQILHRYFTLFRGSKLFWISMSPVSHPKLDGLIRGKNIVT